MNIQSIHVFFLKCFVLLPAVLLAACLKPEFAAQDCSGGGPACVASYAVLEVTSQRPNYPVIFLTAATTRGDFQSPLSAGPKGADEFCSQNLPSGVTGTFKALIVGSNITPSGNDRKASNTANAGDGQIQWVLKSNQTYQRPDSTIIGTTNANGLFNFPLQNPFAVSGSFWSGLSTDWTNGTNNCVGSGGAWDPAGGGSNGLYGDASQTSSAAISSASQGCTNTHSILCVEQ